MRNLPSPAEIIALAQSIADAHDARGEECAPDLYHAARRLGASPAEAEAIEREILASDAEAQS